MLGAEHRGGGRSQRPLLLSCVRRGQVRAGSWSGCRTALVLRRRRGGYESRFARGEHLLEQSQVSEAIFGFGIEQLLTEIQLAVDAQTAVVGQSPNGSPMAASAVTIRCMTSVVKLLAPKSLFESCWISRTKLRICCLVCSTVAASTGFVAHRNSLGPFRPEGGETNRASRM